MIIEDIYNQSKYNFLFNNSEEFKKLRKNILDRFDLTPKNKKNNESLKHLDPSFLQFSYKYKDVSSKINYFYGDENKIGINVIDGKIFKIERSSKDNLSVKFYNSDNRNNNFDKNFLNYQKSF